MVAGTSPLALFLTVLLVQVAESYQENSREEAIRIHKKLSETRHGLTALRNVIEELDEELQKTEKLKDLVRKRKGLEILRRILEEIDADLVFEQKRNCRFNLGGHCATESAAAMADQWHYLNSPMSPGRKRRDTNFYKKLMSGQIIKV